MYWVFGKLYSKKIVHFEGHILDRVTIRQSTLNSDFENLGPNK